MKINLFLIFFSHLNRSFYILAKMCIANLETAGCKAWRQADYVPGSVPSLLTVRISNKSDWFVE